MSNSGTRHPSPWLAQRAETGVSPEALALAIGAQRQPAILESPCHSEPYGRYSLFAAGPVAVVQASRCEGSAGVEGLLGAVTADTGIAPAPLCPSWAGGWVGHFAYEAGLVLEGLPLPAAARAGPPGDEPLARFALYDAFALRDGRDGSWRVVAAEPEAVAAAIAAAREAPGFTLLRDPVSPARDKLREVLDLLEGAIAGPSFPPPRCGPMTAALDRRAYHERFDAAMDYIARGHIYQVNLTQRFATITDASSLDLYQRLRRLSPASHGAFLAWDDRAIMSASPELFLQQDGRRVLTRPIKGTRPRGNTPSEDAALRCELATSEKDTAELAMIVDLLRNDLGKVCRFGTVRVTEEAAIETWPTLFHRTATIEGELAADMTRADLLRATLPGGSITGCPKRRAMEIISELEPVARGVYCGAIGAIGLAGGMQLNVAIRTMIRRGREVFVHAGGAITSDSDAAGEYAELLAKARAMLLALGTNPQALEPQPRTAAATT
jgi:para-aminobenzoate synthetase component 1